MDGFSINRAGHSQREIAGLVELPLSIVNSIIVRINKTNSPMPRGSSGAPMKVDERDLKHLWWQKEIIERGIAEASDLLLAAGAYIIPCIAEIVTTLRNSEALRGFESQVQATAFSYIIKALRVQDFDYGIIEPCWIKLEEYMKRQAKATNSSLIFVY
ncbi:hypothetical protein EDC96DRAFT_575642 [Choanephora cucurbitarum]|nr:hypothetical protein EDC96DRAFT_575642 [Choanephora cucurbitarum]